MNSLLLAYSRNGNDYQVRQFLRENLGDPDTKDFDGKTCLIVGIENGHSKVVEELLNAGANPNLSNAQGKSPLQIAKDLQRTDIIQLLEGKIDVDKEIVEKRKKKKQSKGLDAAVGKISI